ncbi:AMP-binding protein [Paremcibacter congregatus]|uniref:AMP-binding protein n=1 Tax=Paremcibacter congregatus TaxID=2043170 RepID=UPI003A91EA5F
MNIAIHMTRAGQVYREYPAIAEGDILLSNYGDLAHRVACIATALRQEYGLQVGDRVALILRNCPEYLELLYGCWHAGLVTVPINAKLHPSDFAYILANSGAKLCFASPGLGGTVRKIDGVVLEEVIDVPGKNYSGFLNYAPSPVVYRAPEETAWLFYTSGTTGQPKGATLSHRNLLSMCHCYFSDVDSGGPWGAFLHAAPMSHGSGLYGLAHVMQGSCHVIPESGGFDPAEIYDLIESWPGVSFFAAPTMVKRLLDFPDERDTRNLKTIIYGGGPMYVEDCLAGLKRFGPKLAQLYGQGESPMTITALNAALHQDSDHPRWRDRLASVGVAQSAVEVRIADEAGSFLPVGEVGEVVVRGDTVMTGYWNNPQATAETVKEGWLYTGDYGVLDADGFLTLKDRSKDVIISGGTNIYPREVEEVLLRHPAIEEVSVIGRPDREWGETVVAYVVVCSDAATDQVALEDFCLTHMARFKRPKFYRFVEQLPKNNYGKVLKTTLRKWDQTDEV